MHETEGMKNQNTCCSTADGEHRLTHRPEELRKKLIDRLSRIEGQVRGLKGMVERDAYCADILTQSAAVNAAINSFNRDLLARHIHTCVAQDIRAGDDGAADELVELLARLMK